MKAYEVFETAAIAAYVVSAATLLLALTGIFYLGPPDTLMPIVPLASGLLLHASTELFSEGQRDKVEELGLC